MEERYLSKAAYDHRNHELLRAIWDALIYTGKKPEPERYEKYLDDMCTQRNLAEVYQALNLFNISKHDNGLGKGTRRSQAIIRIPVLAIRGDRDLVVTEKMTDELVRIMKAERSSLNGELRTFASD